MLTLTSMASKAAGLKEYIKNNKADDEVLMNTEFHQGDVVNTIITCANGETILLTLDTTLPRYYSRGFTVQGTKGMYFEDNQSLSSTARSTQKIISSGKSTGAMWKNTVRNTITPYGKNTWKRAQGRSRRHGLAGIL